MTHLQDIYRIANGSVSVLARSLMLFENKVVWAEIGPDHPKAIGAIWASLVSGHALSIRGPRCATVYGLGRKYVRFHADAPRLVVGRARPQFVRLIAPEAVRIERAVDNSFKDFLVIGWPGITPGNSLAAGLEKFSEYPMRIGWGDFLLAKAVSLEKAHPLTVYGNAPGGYAVDGNTPWGAFITTALKLGDIRMDGSCSAAALTFVRRWLYDNHPWADHPEITPWDDSESRSAELVRAFAQ